MKKVIVFIFCFFYVGSEAQTLSTIQVKDLIVVEQPDTLGTDTAGFSKYYLFTAKIDSISEVSKVYFKVGTANDLDNVYSVLGTVQEAADPGGLGSVYSVTYNGSVWPFRNYTTMFLLPKLVLSGSYPLVATFYIEDESGRFSKKLYHLINE